MRKLSAGDWINLGLLIATLMTAFGAFAVVWGDSRYARLGDFQELKGEIDAMYLHSIPQRDQAPLQHPQKLGQ